jgi:hypothetical protein
VYPSLRLPALVAELAAGLRPPADIWREHGVFTRHDAKLIAQLPLVRQMLAEEQQRWQSRESLSLRVKAKAGALIEDSMPFIHASVINPLHPLSHRVAAFTALAKMAGVDMPPEARGTGMGAGAGGGVAISISMDLGGGNVVGVKVGGEVVDADAVAEGDEGDADGFLLNPADYMVGDDGDGDEGGDVIEGIGPGEDWGDETC